MSRGKTSLAEHSPHLVAEWSERNGDLTPWDVPFASNRKVWWRCPVADDHEWDAPPSARSRGSGCPCCAGLKVVLSNCLATTHPELAKQWHPRNQVTARDVTFGCSTKFLWRCPAAEDHVWESNVINRVNGRGCPCCSGKKVVLSNCLATTHPELAKQWHPKNGALTPRDLVAGANRKVWWRCPVADDHEWDASVNDRTGGGCGCPCCAGQKTVLSNCLATTHPEIARQWHPKNGAPGPHQVARAARRKVWWKCDAGHEWEAAVYSRTGAGNGCPHCSGSNGEKAIAAALERLNVVHQREHMSNVLRPKGRPFAFDFVVALKGRRLGVIEFHGGQHYKPVEFWGGENGLRKTQERDRKKREYCKQNGYPFLEIPFWDFDRIDELVDEFVNRTE